MLKFISKSVSLINDLNHYDWVCDEKLLDQACCLDFWVRHQKNYHHFDFVHEWEKVKQLGNIVQNRVKNPVCSPMSELGIILFFASEFGQEKQCFVGGV